MVMQKEIPVCIKVTAWVVCLPYIIYLPEIDCRKFWSGCMSALFCMSLQMKLLCFFSTRKIINVQV